MPILAVAIYSCPDGCPDGLQPGDLFQDCSGGGGTDDPPPDAPAAIVFESGHQQEGDCGEWLEDPVVVRVEDAHLNPVPDVFVAWDLPEDADVDPAEGATDSKGRAYFGLRLGWEPGDYTATVQSDPSLSVTVTFEPYCPPISVPPPIQPGRPDDEREQRGPRLWEVDFDLAYTFQTSQGFSSSYDNPKDCDPSGKHACGELSFSLSSTITGSWGVVRL